MNDLKHARIRSNEAISALESYGYLILRGNTIDPFASLHVAETHHPKPRELQHWQREHGRSWHSLIAIYELGYECNKCHEINLNMTADHIHEKQDGGRTYRQNMQPLCGHCHSRKTHLFRKLRERLGKLSPVDSQKLNSRFLAEDIEYILQTEF